MNKFTLKTSLLSLTTAILLGLSGCSGGGGSSSGTVGGNIANAISKAYSGTGIDGILVGSTVCIDANDNGACDIGEPSAVTNAQGKFEILETTVTGPLLLIGGTDIGTGLPFTGSLTAPAGSTVVTPLTSAVQSLVKSGKSPAEAEANVKAALGVPAGVNLTTFDPFESANDANATVAAQAQAVMASQAHLQTIVHAASVAVGSAASDQNTSSVMGDVFAQISESFDGATTDVNLSVADVTAVTKAVANDLYANNQVALVSVKNNAEATAQSAVDAAEATQADIEAGTPAQAEARLNTGITLVNTSIAADINASTAASVDAADDLNATTLQAIVDAQAEQEAKEAEIAAAIQAAKEAAEALAAAKIAVANAAAADAKAAYDALLEAQAEQLRQAEVERAAHAAAEEAAALAAAQEAQLAVNQAAILAAQRVAAAELAAAQAQAAAEAAEAAARIAAAEEAAAQAKAAVDLAAAQTAAANAERNAAVNIMKTQAESLVASAYGYISQVTAARDSIVFIRSLDANYTTDANITTSFNSAEAALVAVENRASDANVSAQILYDFATLVALESNVTDANVSDANTSLQFVIGKEALASAEVVTAQTALDDVRARVLVIQSALAVARAEAAALVEKNRVIALIQTALDTANDNNVSGNLADINSTLASAFSDFNATLAIATEYAVLGISMTDARTAYDRALVAQTEAQSAAEDLNDSLTIMNAELVKANDANTTEVIAEEEVANARRAALTVAARLLEIGTIKTGLATALGTATTAKQDYLDGLAADKAGRIQGMATTVAGYATAVNIILSDATQDVLDVNSSVQAMYEVASTYNSSEALTLANEANATATDLLGYFDALTMHVQTINDANSTMALAVISQDEVNATATLASAQTAKEAIDVIGGLVVPLIDEIEGKALLVEAIKLGFDSNTVKLFDQMKLYNVKVKDDGTFKAKRITLNGVNGEILEHNYNVTTTVFDEHVSDDLVLKDGSWIAEDMHYTLNEATGIATFTDGRKVKLDHIVSLPNSTIDAAINLMIPGDTDVSFSGDDTAYYIAFQEVESYKVWYKPNENGNNYTTLESLLKSSEWHIGGEDSQSGGYTSVTFNDVPATLTATSADDLMFGTQVIGSWSVVTLPVSGDLAVIYTVHANKQYLLNDDDENLIALVTNVVYIGEYTQATDFAVEENPSFNDSAFTSIVNIIAASVGNGNTNELTTLLSTKTLWSQLEGNNGTLGSQAFNDDATQLTWTEIVNPGEDLCDGNVSVVFESNSTITLTVIKENCTNPETPGTSLNMPIAANQAWNYILVDGNKWYFDEGNARADFLSGGVPSNFDMASYFAGKTLYSVNDEGAGKTPAQMTFETDGTYKGVDNDGAWDHGEGYEFGDNNTSLILHTVDGTTQNVTFRHKEDLENGAKIFDVKHSITSSEDHFAILFAVESDRNASIGITDIDASALQGKTIFFENNNSKIGVRTFNSNGTTTGLISGFGTYEGKYIVHENSIIVIPKIGKVTTLSFVGQPDFSAIDDLQSNVTVGSQDATSTWNVPASVPTNLLNVTISYRNENNVSGTRTFNERGITVDENGNPSAYYYDTSTGKIAIRNGVTTTEITLGGDLASLPIVVTYDVNGSEAYNGTTAWNVGSGLSQLADVTVYTGINNVQGTLESWVFNPDMTKVTILEIVNGDGSSEDMNITIIDATTMRLTAADGNVTEVEVVDFGDDKISISIQGENTLFNAYAYEDAAKLDYNVSGATSISHGGALDINKTVYETYENEDGSRSYNRMVIKTATRIERTETIYNADGTFKSSVDTNATYNMNGNDLEITVEKGVHDDFHVFKLYDITGVTMRFVEFIDKSQDGTINEIDAIQWFSDITADNDAGWDIYKI